MERINMMECSNTLVNFNMKVAYKSIRKIKHTSIIVLTMVVFNIFFAYFGNSVFKRKTWFRLWRNIKLFFTCRCCKTKKVKELEVKNEWLNDPLITESASDFSDK